MPPKIIISGAPASGKGTQCEFLKKDFGMVHLSTGDMLRDAIANRTETGLKAKDFVENGKLVPDEIIINVILDRLKEQDCVTKGWLLDGFPRSAGQADALQKNGVIPDIFIQLEVLDELLLERVVGRRTDPVTGVIYHMKFKPPENEEIKARLQHRADDTEEKFSVRLKGYHANTAAILDYFKSKLFTVKVDSASMTPAIIYDKLKAKLDTLYGKSSASTKKAPKLIISGAPASGKGTQCEFLKKDFGMVHLSTGDMLRDAIANRTETGLKAKDFVENGKLVPDEIIINVILDRLKEQDCVTKGWLLDGFPRSASQADALQKNGVIPDIFIQLEVLDELLLERVVGRRTDPVTGVIYHMKFKPPENEEIKARLQHRADDTEEKFSVRLKGYHANTAAILDYFKPKLFTVKVDSASMTPAIIYDKIKAKLDVVYGGNSKPTGNAAASSTRLNPKEQALDYWNNKGISHLFEFLTTRLLVEKPDNPNQFILAEINKIEKLKSIGKPAVEYNEDELVTMFLAFDVTSKGSVAASQYLQALSVLGVSNPSNPTPQGRIDKDAFVKNIYAELSNRSL